MNTWVKILLMLSLAAITIGAAESKSNETTLITPSAETLIKPSAKTLIKPSAETPNKQSEIKEQLPLNNVSPTEISTSEEIFEEIFPEEKSQTHSRMAEPSLRYKSVAEKIHNLKHTSLTNFINQSSLDKLIVFHISSPFSLSFAQRAIFSDRQFIETRDNLTINVTNIKTINFGSPDAIDAYTNQYFCHRFNKLEINLSVHPYELYTTGSITAYRPQSNVTCYAHFEQHQYNGSLLYNVPFNEITNWSNVNFISFSDLEYKTQQTKISSLCQSETVITAAISKTSNYVKQNLSQKIATKTISNHITELGALFPPMSTCLSTTTNSSPTYYIVRNTTTKTWKSHNMEFGPIVIKGLHQFDLSNITTHRNCSDNKAHFDISITTGHILGQCDWQYYKIGESKGNNSFTFVIDNMTFNFQAKLRKYWHVLGLNISIGYIQIHRLNKSCHVIHNFTKDLIRNTIKSMLNASLTQSFYENHPEPTTNTNTVKTIKSTIQHGFTKPETISTDEDEWYLPFPTRKIFVCQDTRKWWQKPFSFIWKNYC